MPATVFCTGLNSLSPLGSVIQFGSIQNERASLGGDFRVPHRPGVTFHAELKIELAAEYNLLGIERPFRIARKYFSGFLPIGRQQALEPDRFDKGRLSLQAFLDLPNHVDRNRRRKRRMSRVAGAHIELRSDPYGLANIADAWIEDRGVVLRPHEMRHVPDRRKTDRRAMGGKIAVELCDRKAFWRCSRLAGIAQIIMKYLVANTVQRVEAAEPFLGVRLLATLQYFILSFDLSGDLVVCKFCRVLR